MDERVPPIDTIQTIYEPRNIIKKQLKDGSWKYNGNVHEVYPAYHYYLVATFKNFLTLITRFEFNNNTECINRAAEFPFSCQSEEGDFRGFIGNQYATYFTGTILSLLIDAGYENDSRVSRGMQWLLSMRQQDGGWTIPIQTHKFDKDTIYRLTSQYAEPVESDRSQPFSHNWTNMILQAFSSHSRYRKSMEAITAARLLKTRFFQPDVYSSYKAASNWTRFRFWWPNIVTALRSLSYMGFSSSDPDIILAISKLVNLQSKDGLWNLEQDRMAKEIELEERQWVSLKICRTLKWYLNK